MKGRRVLPAPNAIVLMARALGDEIHADTKKFTEWRIFFCNKRYAQGAAKGNEREWFFRRTEAACISGRFHHRQGLSISLWLPWR